MFPFTLAVPRTTRVPFTPLHHPVDSGTDYLNDALKEQFDVRVLIGFHRRNCEASRSALAGAATPSEAEGVGAAVAWGRGRAVRRRAWAATTGTAGTSDCAGEAWA